MSLASVNLLLLEQRRRLDLEAESGSRINLCVKGKNDSNETGLLVVHATQSELSNNYNYNQ